MVKQKNKTAIKIINIIADIVSCVSAGLIFLKWLNRDIWECHWLVLLLVAVSVITLITTLVINDMHIINGYYSRENKTFYSVAAILKSILGLILFSILLCFCNVSGVYSLLFIIEMGILGLVLGIPIAIAYTATIHAIKKATNATRSPINTFGVIGGLVMIIIIFLGFVYPRIIEPSMLASAKDKIEGAFQKYDGCTIKNIAASRQYGVAIATIGPCTANSALISYGTFYTSDYNPQEGETFLGTFEYSPVAELEEAIPGAATHKQQEHGGLARAGDTYVVAEGSSWDVFKTNYLQTIENYMSLQGPENKMIVYLLDSYNGHKEDLKSLLFPHSSENFVIRARLEGIGESYGVRLVNQKILKCDNFHGKCELYDAYGSGEDLY